MDYGKPHRNAVRSFIAVELSNTIQQQLEMIIGHLKGPLTSVVRWVPTNNIHLTLKFLGDVTPVRMTLLKTMLKTEIGKQQSFSLMVSGLGAFPTAKRPRVVWIGIDTPPHLDGLVRMVDTETVKLGYPGEDRPFSPHLTLGRVAQNATPLQVRQVADALAVFQVAELGHLEVREVVLFKSDLRPSGAEYSPLLRIPLRKR